MCSFSFFFFISAFLHLFYLSLHSFSSPPPPPPPPHHHFCCSKSNFCKALFYLLFRKSLRMKRSGRCVTSCVQHYVCHWRPSMALAVQTLPRGPNLSLLALAPPPWDPSQPPCEGWRGPCRGHPTWVATAPCQPAPPPPWPATFPRRPAAPTLWRSPTMGMCWTSTPTPSQSPASPSPHARSRATGSPGWSSTSTTLPHPPKRPKWVPERKSLCPAVTLKWRRWCLRQSHVGRHPRVGGTWAQQRRWRRRCWWTWVCRAMIRDSMGMGQGCRG